MKKTSIQAIEKIIQAKQLENEALMMLVPERYRKHLNVISREMTALLIEAIEDIGERCEEHLSEYEKAEEPSADMRGNETEREDASDSEAKKVRKVDIG